MLKFRCPCSCESTLVVPDGSEGSPTRCPYSGSRIFVEGASPFLEADWFGCTRPGVLLQALGSNLRERKSRLFACACINRQRHLIDRKLRDNLCDYERFADGQITWNEISVSAMRARYILEQRSTRLSREAEVTWGVARLLTCGDPDLELKLALHIGQVSAQWVGKWAVDTEMKVQCELFRDIFRNPFRPALLRPEWIAWNDAAVRVASAIYEANDFGDLPYLADALEDAGCDDQHILEHCREPGGHARGCWVVDAVLGRS